MHTYVLIAEQGSLWVSRTGDHLTDGFCSWPRFDDSFDIYNGSNYLQFLLSIVHEKSQWKQVISY